MDRLQKYQKALSAAALFALAINLIVGGILLPQKAAAQYVDEAALGQRVEKSIFDHISDAWKQVKTTLIAGYNAVMVELGISDQVQKAIEKALKWAWNVLRKTLLNMLVDDIIRWIQGGGSPRIVSDWQGFLKTAVDRTGGAFVEQYLKMGYLCNSFRGSLQILLAQVPTFDQASTCTISQIVSNIEDFFNDFNRGGWKAWITVSETQNNLYGAYLWALDQKWGLEAASAQASQNEGIASAGFLGDKVCVQACKKPDLMICDGYFSKDNITQEKVPEGYQCTKWQTRTPGKIAADAVSKAVTVDIDWLINADEFNEYLGAIFNAVINRAIREGVTAMQTSGGTSGGGNGVSTSPVISVNIDDYADSSKAEVLIPQAISQAQLYKENLEKNLSELQTNINLLNQVKTTQAGAFSLLQSMLQSGCPVPGGASQIDMGDQFTTTCNAAHTNCPCTETRTASTKITTPSSGEAILNRVTTTKWEGYSFSCMAVSTQATSTVTIASSPVDSEIQKINSDISTTNSAISRANTVLTDLQKYQTEASSFKKAYEAAQNSARNTSSVSANAMKAAKTKAIGSLQVLLGSSKNDLQELFDLLTQKNQTVANQAMAAQQKRGMLVDCKYKSTISGTYYGMSCDAQDIKNTWQAAATACSAGAGSFGISGG